MYVIFSAVVWNISDKDEQGNVAIGDVLMQDSVNSLVLSDHRLVTTLGLSNTVVVETSDAVLVADKNAIQDENDIQDGHHMERFTA